MIIKKYERFILLLSLMMMSLILPYFGGALNNLVVSANNGMPVLTDYQLQSPNTHFIYSNFNQVHYPILTDIITIKNTHYSIGDILIYSGLFLVVFFGILAMIYGFKLFKEREKYLNIHGLITQ